MSYTKDASKKGGVKNLLRRFIRAQKKRENPAFRSSHTLRLWHAQPIKDEQRTETHADEFIQLSQYPVDGYNQIQDTYKNIPWASIVALYHDR